MLLHLDSRRYLDALLPPDFVPKLIGTFCDLRKRVFVYHGYVDAINFLKLAEHIHFGPSDAASPQPVLEVEDQYIF